MLTPTHLLTAQVAYLAGCIAIPGLHPLLSKWIGATP